MWRVYLIAINKDTDVYTENKRCLVEIKFGGNIGNVLMLVVKQAISTSTSSVPCACSCANACACALCVPCVMV